MKKIFTSLTCALALTAFAVQAQHNLYITNQTGWTDVSLYTWGDVNDAFGGWPGMKATSTETVNGVAYDVFVTPASVNGKSQNLIYNNGSAQLADLNVVLDKDYYLAAWPNALVIIDPNHPLTPPTSETCTLYVDNLSSWTKVCAYAYAPTGGPEIFGNWPGAASQGVEVIKGTRYLTYEMPVSTTEYVLMFSNDGSDTEKIEGEAFVPSADKFVRINAAGTSYEFISDPRAESYALYIENKTGWAKLNVYVWGSSEIFGKWPGATASETVTVNGISYEKFPYTADAEGFSANVILNDGDKKQYDAITLTAPGDYYFTATPTEMSGVEDVMVEETVAPVYYNLSGVRVDNPEDGIFIEVRGSKAVKVRL